MSENKYKDMWNILKENIDKRVKEYISGNCMSISEALWGSAIYNHVKEKMKKLEEEFGVD